MSEQTEKLIRDSFPDAVIETTDVFGTLNVKITPGSLVPICELLHEHGFNYLADITAVDWAPPSVPPLQGGKIDAQGGEDRRTRGMGDATRKGTRLPELAYDTSRLLDGRELQ